MNQNNFNMGFRKMVVGLETKVPLLNGKRVTAINFDNAATTPPFVSVMQEINKFAPWYSSIHRGTGFKSQLSSQIYEESRNEVLDFVKADPEYYTVIYGKNTTEAVNKLSFRLYKNLKGCVVLSTRMEHHSNDLPWRDKYYVRYVNVDETGRISLEDLERKLRKYCGKVKLVTITGVSNVTGYINPIYQAAEIAHKYKAKILIDGAQLLAHCPFDMKPVGSRENIDFLVFSGHKMYAPFGTGVIIGPKRCFKKGRPEYTGGGTVKLVTRRTVIWDEVPHKEEAGTTNIMGVVALLASIRTLKRIGLDKVCFYEKSLADYALQKMREIPNLIIYGDAEECNDRIGIIPFNIEGIPHHILARILSDERGIAVRNGCFCAQPYIQKLLKLSSTDIKKYIKKPTITKPGMVRISFGLYNTFSEIDALEKLLKNIGVNKDEWIEKYKSMVSEST